MGGQSADLMQTTDSLAGPSASPQRPAPKRTPSRPKSAPSVPMNEATMASITTALGPDQQQEPPSGPYDHLYAPEWPPVVAAVNSGGQSAEAPVPLQSHDCEVCGLGLWSIAHRPDGTLVGTRLGVSWQTRPIRCPGCASAILNWLSEYRQSDPPVYSPAELHFGSALGATPASHSMQSPAVDPPTPLNRVTEAIRLAADAMTRSRAFAAEAAVGAVVPVPRGMDLPVLPWKAPPTRPSPRMV